MYCDNCGNELENEAKFCMKCGTKVLSNASARNVVVQEKWWDRLFKVIYILGYLPLILVVVLGWSESSSAYDYNLHDFTDTPGIATWYSFLAILIYFGIMRLIKLAYLYIAKGLRPNWKGEFTKFI